VDSRELCRISVVESVEFRCVALSGDGKLLAAKLTAAPGDHIRKEWFGGPQIRVWETATGHEVLRLDTPDASRGLAFSPAGPMLLAGGKRDGFGVVTVWDLARARCLATLAGHSDEVNAVAFAADSRTFASGGDEGTIVLWDAARVLVQEPDRSRPQPAEGVWADLTSPDTARAWRAVWNLQAQPGEALAMLKTRLSPTTGPDAKEVARRLADLDHDDYDTREAASAWLAQRCELLEPALRRALVAGPSAEVQRRLRELLELTDPTRFTPQRMLALRATAVLEAIGNKEARELLRTLATGAPDALLTREAKAALLRLQPRP
jgi:hypothetical protein